MPESKCESCNAVYTIKEGEADDGFCCFDCWEEANCLEPEEYNLAMEA